MRLRAFSKHGGPRLLRATSAVRFRRTSNGLRLERRPESFATIYVGDGVELVGVAGYQQEYPPCEVGVPVGEQPVLPCTAPQCEEVDDVEPCVPSDDPGEGEGVGPVDVFEHLVNQESLLTGMADVYTSALEFTPASQDSITADSVGLFLGDTLGSTIGVLVDHDGLPVAAFADVSGATVGLDLAYSGDDLTTMDMQFVSEFGDTIVVEITPEMTESELRADMMALKSTKMQSLYGRLASYLGPCGPEFAAFMVALSSTGIAVGKLAFRVAAAINPAVKSFKLLKSGMQIGGAITGVLSASAARNYSISQVIRQALLDFTGVGGVRTDVLTLGATATATGLALYALDSCLGGN